MAPINRTLKRSAALALALVGAVASPALAQKTAFVASEEILARLPEVKEARARLAEYQSTWMREIQQQEGDIQKQRNDMESNRLLWSNQERREAEGKLKDLEAKLSQFRASKYDTGGEYQKLHDEMLGPLYEKVFTAINDEAKAQKYDFVFDKSSRGMPMLYSNPDFDLTAAVLKRLGVKFDATEPAEGTDGTTTDAPAPRRGRSRPAETDPNSVLGDPDKERETESSTR